MDKVTAEQLLKTALNNSEVSFRDGQWEAIDSLVNLFGFNSPQLAAIM